MSEQNTDNQNQESAISDPMIAAFFEQPEQEKNIENEKTEEQLKEEQRLADEASEDKKKQEERQEQERVAKEEQEKLAAEEKRKKEEEAAVKSKPWDEGLDNSAKFVLDKLSKGEDKEVYELLKAKFGYESLSDEEKMLQYIHEKNPHLTKDDLAFKAAQEYGIGTTQVDEDDLTDDDKLFLRRQEIERKGLLSEAEKFFKDKAVNVVIPELPNPVDIDEEYKEFKALKAQQEALQEEQNQENERIKKQNEDLTIQIHTTSKEIETLPIDMKIDLDQSEFAFKSEFKLDEKKQKELADYAIEYTPTQGELKQHQDQDGKLNMKGYMTMLASKLFAPQIQKALVKQAIAKDREEFTERELKNSTLRSDNDGQFVPSNDFNFEEQAMGK